MDFHIDFKTLRQMTSITKPDLPFIVDIDESRNEDKSVFFCETQKPDLSYLAPLSLYAKNFPQQHHSLFVYPVSEKLTKIRKKNAELSSQIQKDASVLPFVHVTTRRSTITTTIAATNTTPPNTSAAAAAAINSSTNKVITNRKSNAGIKESASDANESHSGGLSRPSVKFPKILETEEKRDGSFVPGKRKSSPHSKSSRYRTSNRKKSTGHNNLLASQIRGSLRRQPPTHGKSIASIQSAQKRKGSDHSRRSKRPSKQAKKCPCKCCQLEEQNCCALCVKKLAESEKCMCALFVLVIILIVIGIVCLITFPILAATGYFHSIHHHKF